MLHEKQDEGRYVCTLVDLARTKRFTLIMLFLVRPIRMGVRVRERTSRRPQRVIEGGKGCQEEEAWNMSPMEVFRTFCAGALARPSLSSGCRLKHGLLYDQNPLPVCETGRLRPLLCW